MGSSERAPCRNECAWRGANKNAGQARHYDRQMGLGDQERRRGTVNLLDYMTVESVRDLARALRKTGDGSSALAREVERANRNGGGQVRVKSASIEKMLIGLPKGKPQVRHIRNVVKDINGALDRAETEARERVDEPDRSLLTNPASDGRSKRVSRRDSFRD